MTFTLFFCFLCLNFVEGITDQGLYRIVGVGSKVQNLLFQCIEQKKVNDADLSDDECEWEVKTITSALKQHLRYGACAAAPRDCLPCDLSPRISALGARGSSLCAALHNCV